MGCAARKSFKLGTVRMLNDAVDADEWKRLKKFIDKQVERQNLTVVGTGGNINRYHKVARIKKASHCRSRRSKSGLNGSRKCPCMSARTCLDSSTTGRM